MGWGLCTPSQFRLFQHMVSFSFQEEEVVIRNGCTPDEKRASVLCYGLPKLFLVCYRHMLLLAHLINRQVEVFHGFGQCSP